MIDRTEFRKPWRCADASSGGIAAIIDAGHSGTSLARCALMPIRHRCVLIALCLSVVVTVTASVSAATVRVYQIEDLGFFPGNGYLVGYAINVHGDVAGSFLAADGMMHAFRWTAAAGLEDLGTNGGFASLAFAMNDAGDVVGTYWDRNWGSHPFIASPGRGMTDVGLRYPEIQRLNGVTNDLRLVGYTWGWHAFRTLRDGTLQELTSMLSIANGINENGDVTGAIWPDGSLAGPSQAFRYADATGLVALGTIAGGSSGGRAINMDGVVAGFSGVTTTIPTRAFRAKPGMAMEDLGVLPRGFLASAGNAVDAYALNDRGDVVGIADGWFTWTPFLYTDAMGIVDLKFHITLQQQLAYLMEDASGINHVGQIIVHYSNFDGSKFGTARLTPFDREFGGPVAAPTVDTPVLRPPDNRMVWVSVDPHVTDEYDAEPLCRVTRVINSEQPATGPDPDVSIDYGLSVQLRATRRGSGPGRTYTIVLSCSDRLGVTSETNIVVNVPHDER